LTNEELLQGVKTAYEQGWDKIKLYFMIGLPGETDTDVLGIAETLRWLQRECRGKGKRYLNFNVTISNFTPKPHTPFQWHSVSTTEFKRKQELLRQEFRTLRGVKANFTDVRISAMEDFLGRGDRRLASVVRRAWELGAGMDAWWESLDRAYAAWTQAIDESELTWKYRQVENGEWNVMPGEHLETLQATQAELPLPNLDAPLPWDHLDTGIDKQWLKADLQRALEAAIVPDCSFEGCSHCGVCGADFGHNVVVPPLPIPKFEGQFIPNQERVQRLRVWFGKIGDMAMISHLDLIRLFDRAIRRAAIPIAFTGGFHPGPRIAPASALPLGVTSTGEIVDFDLIEAVDVEAFSQKLSAQLPAEIPVYRVEAIAPHSASATQLVDRAEYVVSLGRLDPSSEVPTTADWLTWIAQILTTQEIWMEQTTKSGQVRQVNLRDRLFELQWVDPQETERLLPFAMASDAAVLRFIGVCHNDGNFLRPEHLTYMLQQVSGCEFQLFKVHRQQLLLSSSDTSTIK
jgi:radical SAM-linked protein